MTIILEQFRIPEKGSFEIHQTITLAISSTEARRKVNRWLLMEVSDMIGADDPTLVVGERTIWRVPAYFSAPHIGLVGRVGVVDVDAEAGELLHLEHSQAAIEQRASALAATLPPFNPYTTVPAECIAADIPPAPRLMINEDGTPFFAELPITELPTT